MDALGDSLAALENWYYGQITRGEPLYPPEYGKVLTSAVSLDEVRQTLQSYSYSVCYAVTAEPGTQGKGAARMLNNDHESFAAAQARAAAAVSCESVVLPSGLTVLCRTMPGYSSVHAIYATGFGSVHRAFRLDGKQVTLPAGTAHFLEHKMCETPKGDSFTFYAKTGASANAFTSYDRTCYLFSATQKIDENLDILLGMVASRGSPSHDCQGAGHHRAGDQNVRRQPRLAAAERAVPLPLRRPPAARRHRGHSGEHCRADTPDALQLHQGVLRAVQYGAERRGQDHAGAGCGRLQAQRPVPRPCPA